MKKVYVIGGAVIDIMLYPHQKMILRDSNPGFAIESMGGVGRNIAENLSRLGFDVTLLTTLGNDTHGKRIMKHAKDCHLGLDIIEANQTPAYYAVIDENQDDLIGIAVMDEINLITKDEVFKRLNVINQSDLVVLDTNLSSDTLAYLFEHIHRPIFMDAISTQKAVKLKPFFHKIFGLKVNQLEAETLTEMKFHEIEDLNLMGDFLNHQGIHHVFITLGKKGAYYANKDFGIFRQSIHIDIKNPTGAGDAFLSGAIYAYLHDKPMLEYAITNARLNLTAHEAVHQHLNEDLLIKTMEEMFQ